MSKTKLAFLLSGCLSLAAIVCLVLLQNQYDNEVMPPVDVGNVVEEIKTQVESRSIQLSNLETYSKSHGTYEYKVKRIRDDSIGDKTVAKYIVNILLHKSQSGESIAMPTIGLVDLGTSDTRGEVHILQSLTK